MPRYDYECDSCKHQFEVKQSFSSEPVANCPRCEGGARRKIHAVPVVFKGSGWYVNDYGKRGGFTATPSSDSKDSSSDSKPDSKPDSKSKSSEVKAESKSKPKAEATSKAEATPAPSAAKDD